MHAQKTSSWVHRDPSKLQTSTVSLTLTTAEKLSIMEALDHIYVTRQYQEMGSCSVCKKISIKKCSACGTFYCSSECQTYDWPQHRIVCSSQRENTSERNNPSKQNRTASIKNLDDENIVLTDRGSPFTALANQLNKKSGSEYGGSKSLANFKIGNSRYQNREQISKGSEAGNILHNGTRDHRKSNTFERKKLTSPKKPFHLKKSQAEEKRGNDQKFNGRNNQNLGERVRADVESVTSSNRKSQSFVAKIEKTMVIGTYRHSVDRYWVMDVNNLEKYEEIQNNLNRNCDKYETITPKLGTLCSCYFADEWFRGMIVSTTPEISVHFVDFGNISKYQDGVFKQLPDNLKSIPSLAFLIEFDENTSSHYRTSDLDSVKFIIEGTSVASDGVPRVRVIQEIDDITSRTEVKTSRRKENGYEKETSFSRVSVMDTVKSTSKGMLILMPGEGTVRYGSLVPQDNKEANDCIEKVLCIDNANSTPYQARDGDDVLVVDKEGNDQRGKVFMSLGSTYYVQLIDCGNTLSTDNVYPLAEDLKQLIQLGVKITIQNMISKSKMEKLESVVFAVTGEAQSGKWPCILKDTENETVASGFLEKPVDVKVWKPQFVDLKSGSTVELSNSHPPTSVFVRVVDGEMEQQFLDMNMEMIQFAPTSKELSEPPLPGELVCARFEEDGCFYRGIVNSVNGSKAGILFVDFGNEQDTNLNDLRTLSPSLKNFPFFALKVTLSNVSRKPWNNMIKEYIARLISENIELTLIYEKSVRDGVILKEKVTGIVVNEFIEKARDRTRVSHSLKSGSDLSTKSEIFLDDDLTYTSIPSGTTCDMVILHVSEYEFETHQTFWATRAGLKNFEYVTSDLTALISEHCSMSAPYQPSYRELCLAEFEGSWYRAICAGKNGAIYKVFFVDFGNVCEIESASIRKMVQKFVKAPALAMNCIINGHEKLKKNAELTEKVCGLLLERTNTCIQGVEVSEFDKDTFLVKIPEVEAILNG